MKLAKISKIPNIKNQEIFKYICSKCFKKDNYIIIAIHPNTNTVILLSTEISHVLPDCDLISVKNEKIKVRNQW